MKKVINKDELTKSMKNVVDMLSNTVKLTLGPSGKNVIIDSEYLSPFITNDGVTIANEIESEHEVENAILKIAKESSIKTNRVVGDGTTTSIVLLQSIFNEGLNSSENKIKLKKDIDASLIKILNKIDEETKAATEEDIINVATISSGDRQIGTIVGSAYNTIKEHGTIVIEESEIPGIKLDIINGLVIKGALASDYMLNELEEYLDNPYILITNNKIKDIGEIRNILNEVIETKKDFLIIAESFSEEVLSDLILLKEQKTLNVVALNALEYSMKQLEILKDICAFTGSTLINKYKNEQLENVMFSNLGQAKKIKITKETVTIIDGLGDKNEINERKESIEKLIKETESDYEKEYLEERLSNINASSAIITVGATTKVEMLEKKMRVEDAVCSCKSALTSGILPGGGITLLKISRLLENENNTEGMKILLKAIKEPFKQILANVGLNSEEIYEEIKKENFTLGVDAKSLKYVDMIKAGIIDSKEVVVTSLMNAVSVATMLLTTESLVINTNSIKTEETKVF